MKLSFCQSMRTVFDTGEFLVKRRKAVHLKLPTFGRELTQFQMPVLDSGQGFELLPL